MGSVLFGQPSQSTVNFFEQVKDRINQKAGVFKEEFIQTSNQIFDSVYSARALELTRAAINKAGALFDPDVIKHLNTLSEIQVAKPTMIRHIMANPFIRQKFIDGRCEGYGEAYIDFEPGKIGENHYDFRRVMDGVVRVDEETGDAFYRLYCEELRPGDEQLSTGQQLDILKTWDSAEGFMRLAAKDPTSPWNSDL
jgi:hypothetical protein